MRIVVNDKMQLGQEFFRWEMATAVAGSIIGINPFDQPDVEAQKIETRKLTAEYEKTGKLPSEEPFFAADGIELYADPRNTGELKPKATSLVAALKAHLDRAHAGDYVATLAYIERNPAHIAALQKMRTAIRDRKKVATCLGFGPRFLHSTGQTYKGGPNSGVILQITCATRMTCWCRARNTPSVWSRRRRPAAISACSPSVGGARCASTSRPASSPGSNPWPRPSTKRSNRENRRCNSG